MRQSYARLDDQGMLHTLSVQKIVAQPVSHDECRCVILEGIGFCRRVGSGERNGRDRS
jgi:hypothetical protein